MSLPTIFSIGHSNHTVDGFVSLLQAHGIDVLLDVRSAPYSRYSPHFNKQSLHAHLTEAGIEYRFAGRELGGRPDDQDCYDEVGSVDYERIAQKPWYARGIESLVEVAATSRIAMMCSEEDPAQCHRHNLIADTLLRDRVAEVWHIRGDGRVEQAELQPRQTRLF